MRQVLAITFDNVSCNTVMSEQLADMLPGFSHVGHTRCFLHIVNLVARSMIKQIDIPKNHAGQNLDIQSQEITPDELIDDTDEGLHGPEVENDFEDQDRARGGHQNNHVFDGAADDDDNIEGWTDEMNLLSTSEHEHIREETRPVKLILVKVIYVKFMEFRAYLH